MGLGSGLLDLLTAMPISFRLDVDVFFEFKVDNSQNRVISGWNPTGDFLGK